MSYVKKFSNDSRHGMSFLLFYMDGLLCLKLSVGDIATGILVIVFLPLVAKISLCDFTIFNLLF